MKWGIYLLIIWVTLAVLPIFAQDEAEVTPQPPLSETIRAIFNADDLTPRLGDPFELTLTVEMPLGAELIEFPEFPEDWSPFLVLETSELMIESLDDGREIYRQELRVLLWDVGDLLTPETFVGYQLAGATDIYYVPVRALSFTVPSMLNPDMNQNELRPLNPQIGLFYVPWWVIAGVISVVAGGAWGGRRWYLRRLNQDHDESIESLDPVIVTRDVISRLQIDQNAPIYAFERIHSQLRWYIAQHLNLQIEHMTAIELAGVIGRHLTADIGRELGQILIYIEQLRFSQGEASEGAFKQVRARSLAWIDSVDAMLMTSVDEGFA